MSAQAKAVYFRSVHLGLVHALKASALQAQAFRLEAGSPTRCSLPLAAQLPLSHRTPSFDALSLRSQKHFESGLAARMRLAPGESGGRYRCVAPERVLCSMSA